MIIISREALVKLGKHAWAVYPLEASGYLVGTLDPLQVFAALPCSKTSKRNEYDDRWIALPEYLPTAERIAASFRLQVVGVYASYDVSRGGSYYPACPLVTPHPLPLTVLYRTECCPQCSTAIVYRDGAEVQRGDDYLIPRGKRITNDINQGSILAMWRAHFGPIDYSNGYTPE
jgi:hypothetical protein